MDARDPPQVVGRYAIYGKIASGGMASVHFGRLAGAAGFSRTVAVKRLHAHLAEDPEFRSTMIDEARLAARIHHPNVVPTLDIVAANRELLLVMEYVRGESLARLLRAESVRRRFVPLPVASAIVIGALHGLHAAHEATSDRGMPLGIVHRDVSPQNILVGVDGVARVIDFGVAKAAGRLQTTSDGAIKGKMAYMAPEQLAGGDQSLAAGKVTRAADVYAVGALFWEMLTGRRLFPGDSDARRALQVLMGAKDPPSHHAPDVPPALDALVMRALALDPADRFASAMDMAETLLLVVPPAFSTDVGKWVEDVASEALALRGAELAQIESLSETMSESSDGESAQSAARSTPVGSGGVAPASGRGRAAPSSGQPARSLTSADDVQTVSSQPSSLSVETPKSGPAYSTRPRRATVVGVLGGTILIAAGVATFLGRGAIANRGSIASPDTALAGSGERANVVPVSATAPPSPSASATDEHATLPRSAEPRPLTTASAHVPPLPSALTPSTPAARPLTPSKARPRPRSSQPNNKNTGGPFRYPQPD